MAAVAAAPAVAEAATGAAASSGAAEGAAGAAAGGIPKPNAKPTKKPDTSGGDGGGKKPPKKIGGVDPSKSPAGKADKAISKANKSFWRGASIASGSKGYNANQTKKWRRILAAEFIVGIMIILFADRAAYQYNNAVDPKTGKKLNSDTVPAQSFTDWIRQLIAFCFAFMWLSFMTIFSPRMGKIAAYLGGLILLTLAVSHRQRIIFLTAGVFDASGLQPSGAQQ